MAKTSKLPVTSVHVSTVLSIIQLMCCGATSFTDYELIFNNISVPMSCCNFTNPLVNMTTCAEIVSNAALANQLQSGLIYAEVRLIHTLKRKYNACN